MTLRFPKGATAAALAASLALAACSPSGNVAGGGGIIETALFTPTYNDDYVPQTYGSRYDCRAMTAQYGAANVWRGLVGGRKQVDFKTRPYSREGCFQTEAECRAFLTYISGFLLQTFTRECRLGA
ncbi:MAG: hypothetical protein HPM95_02045 [Alphaproteobacteria bacterium]|uniref:hypothetical protein n=1 Tax=Stappia TaxID=152161 RepID=UPI001CD35DA8|nr:hypothetical protein [Stappia stellulata]MBL6430520.1 hypothetical protein [Alphaproteobacteria bacterium]MCA1243954.1 hypothetical protein [Stappia stellulata]